MSLTIIIIFYLGDILKVSKEGDLPKEAHIYNFVSSYELSRILISAIAEDQGNVGDISSRLLLARSDRVQASFVARSDGVMCGGAVLNLLTNLYLSCAPDILNNWHKEDYVIRVDLKVPDASGFSKGDILATIEGAYPLVLGIERIALNFLSRLCGISSLTRKYVLAVQGTSAKILDTRKTIPGWRGLSKYAVVCGGGASHRMGLYDAVLWKDNHIANIPLADLRLKIDQAISRSKLMGLKVDFYELEVDSLEQLKEVINCQLNYILLDNMTLVQLREAVDLRNSANSSVLLEASGGVALESVREIAETGVDRISVGALTHSSGIVDIGLDII